MRPGQVYPGTLRRQHLQDASHRHASMRPGQVYPGTPDAGRGDRYLAHRASMRPGQVYPGTRGCGPARLPASRSFNEAGASLPRNTVHQVALVRVRREASMRPGQVYPGTLVGMEGLGAGCAASMRPGQVYPGTRRRPRAPPRCDPRFNEAGASLPRNTALAAAKRDVVLELQ